MPSLTVFAFNSQEIRTVIIDNDVWFVAKDVCEILEHSNSRAALERLDDDEKGVSSIYTLGGNQDMAIVSESGLYSLVLTSRKPQAKAFRKWITAEVIPSIRKTGKYQIDRTPQLPSNYKEALLALIAKEEEREKLEKEAELLRLQNEDLEGENTRLAEIVDEVFDYSSILRIAIFNHVSEKLFDWRRLKAASRKINVEIKQVPCARYGAKNLYSHEAWRYCYPEMKLPELPESSDLAIRS
ncbi:MAG TPA: Bro-N domain-containing protein [Allocoleopsis sp.]